MKKFIFNLESILKLRLSIEENEKIQLYNLKLKHKNLQFEFAELEKTYQDITIERKMASIKGTTVIKLLEVCNYLKELDKKKEEKQDEIDKVLLSINKQSEVLVNLRTEIKTLEKLKEKQISLYKVIEDKENEVMIEDFIAVR
jgi:flagellar export protein FliJ